MTFRLPPLNTLKLFEAAGRARSFASAAKDLGVTASAVSHGIQTLEDWLGAALFARKRGQLVLTPAGAAYLAAVREAFDLLSTEPVADPEHANVLRVTVVPTFASRILIPRLSSFQATYPGIVLSIDTTHRIASFPDDGFDVGIRIGPGDWPGLTVQHLLTESLIAAAAPGFMPAGTRVEDLPDDMLIHATGVKDGWTDYFAGTDRRAPDIARGLRVDTMQMALDAAAEGMGVVLARVPSSVNEIRNGTLEIVSGRRVACKHSYWFVTMPDMAENIAVQALYGWLVDEIEQLASDAQSIC